MLSIPTIGACPGENVGLAFRQLRAGGQSRDRYGFGFLRLSPRPIREGGTSWQPLQLLDRTSPEGRLVLHRRCAGLGSVCGHLFAVRVEVGERLPDFGRRCGFASGLRALWILLGELGQPLAIVVMWAAALAASKGVSPLTILNLVAPPTAFIIALRLAMVSWATATPDNTMAAPATMDRPAKILVLDMESPLIVV